MTLGDRTLVVRRHDDRGAYVYYASNANDGTINWTPYVEDARMLAPRQAALIENICLEQFYTVEVIPFRDSLKDV